MLYVGTVLTKVFGSRNDRLLKRYRRLVEQVNAREAEVRAQTDAQLRQRTQELRAQIVAGRLSIEDALPEGMAVMRESMDRHIGIREIFNPEHKFDPDKLDDEMLQVYDQVQQKLIASGEPWQKVSIPVKLFSATEASKSISFNLLHKGCGSRLKQQYLCLKEDVPVAREVRGEPVDVGLVPAEQPAHVRVPEPACQRER